MAHPILMPKPGQMTEECVLVAWHKREGDPVHKGDVLFEIETDKSIMDVESFEEGVLLKRVVDEGETVPVNAVCAYVGEPGEAVPEEAAAVAADTTSADVPSAVAASAVAPSAVGAGAAGTTMAPRPAPSPGPLRISPRASRLALEAGLDPRTIDGTGPDGRIVERDVRAALDAPDGAPAPATPTPRPADVVQGPDENQPRPLSRMRRVIAERLTRSYTTVPHFSITVAVDVTRILGLRQELRAEGTHLTVTDFVLAATAQSLVELPDVNSRTDGQSVWRRRRVHLGLAVAVPDGLLVAVIRDADRLDLSELHDRAAALVTGAREGTLGVDDMTGSTFTVSNLGMFDIDAFSAIINPGEAAILAVASAIPTPVAINEVMTIRSMLKLTLSADHRLVDGELAARFLNATRRRLEDPDALLRELAST